MGGGLKWKESIKINTLEVLAYYTHCVQQSEGQDTLGVVPPQSAVSDTRDPDERRRQMSAGMVPIKLLLWRCRVVNSLRDPSSVGIVPLRPLLSSFKDVSEAAFPRELGMDPKKVLLANERISETMTRRVDVRSRHWRSQAKKANITVWAYPLMATFPNHQAESHSAGCFANRHSLKIPNKRRIIVKTLACTGSRIQ